MLALKYRNLSLDTSFVFGRTPAEALRQVLSGQVGIPVLEGSLPKQLLFGSNYPRQDIRPAVRGVRALGLSPSLAEGTVSQQRRPPARVEGAAMTNRIERFTVLTRKEVELIDITSTVLETVRTPSGVRSGVVFVLSLHTTTGSTVNEGLPDLEADIAE